jgi:Right handed beta helix region
MHHNTDNQGVLAAISMESSSRLTMSNCTFHNNSVMARPGAKTGGSGGCVVAARGTNVDITDCVFSQNRAYTGAAALLISGNMTLYRSLFADNNATYGTGVDCGPSSHINISECTFLNNAAIESGAVYGRGFMTIEHSIFENNSAGLVGGAVYYGPDGLPVDAGVIKYYITNCTFQYNIAPFGGSVFNYKDAMIISNSTFNSNTAIQDGG